MAGKFQVKSTSDGKTMFNLLAGNGQVILTSQTYTTRQSALDGIASVKTNAASDAAFERRTAKDGSPYFVLVAANKQEIGRSEMYSGTSAMENGIASVKTNAPDAAVVDA
ncbi:MAG: YegP family protein [Gemmatimonadales bacterium]